jgi:hypothetical protein
MKLIGWKIVFTISLLTIINIIISAFEPVVSSGLAIQQLSDTYESNATLTIYEELKKYLWVVYLVIVLLVFKNDWKKLFTKSSDK